MCLRDGRDASRREDLFSKNQDEKMQQPMLPETMVVDFTTSISFYLLSASLKIN
jgi:hypothetical protein